MERVQNANEGEPKIKKRKPLRENENIDKEKEELKFLEILAVIIDKNEKQKTTLLTA